MHASDFAFVLLSDICYFIFQQDSLGKLNGLLDACAQLGVETSPMCVNGLGIVPLFSWYHEVDCFSC